MLLYNLTYFIVGCKRVLGRSSKLLQILAALWQQQLLLLTIKCLSYLQNGFRITKFPLLLFSFITLIIFITVLLQGECTTVFAWSCGPKLSYKHNSSTSLRAESCFRALERAHTHTLLIILFTHWTYLICTHKPIDVKQLYTLDLFSPVVYCVLQLTLKIEVNLTIPNLSE